MPPRGKSAPQTDDVPDALPRGPPAWLHPGGGHDDNASEHYAFLDGETSPRPRGGGRGGGKRGRRGAFKGYGDAWIHPSVADDPDFQDFFAANAEFDAGQDDAPSASSSSMSSMSQPSEYHESAGGGSARAPPRKRAKPTPPGNCYEPDDKEFKAERGVNFMGEDLHMTRMLNGELIKASHKEKEAIRAVAAQPVEDMEAGDGCEAFYLRCRKMLEGGEEDDDFDGDVPGVAAEEARLHMRCKLCKLASARTAEIDANFAHAYDLMMDVELEKCGYTHTAQIYREMAAVFNAQQQTVRTDRREPVFVTSDEVARHFLYHDIGNPLRLMAEQVTALRDILRRQRQFLFGDSDGRNFCNTPKMKIFLTTHKHYGDSVTRFSVMRQMLNIQKPWAKMRIPLPPGANREKSRHLTGAPVEGRFTSAFVK